MTPKKSLPFFVVRLTMYFSFKFGICPSILYVFNLLSDLPLSPHTLTVSNKLTFCAIFVKGNLNTYLKIYNTLRWLFQTGNLVEYRLFLQLCTVFYLGGQLIWDNMPSSLVIEELLLI